MGKGAAQSHSDMSESMILAAVRQREWRARWGITSLVSLPTLSRIGLEPIDSWNLTPTPNSLPEPSHSSNPYAHCSIQWRDPARAKTSPCSSPGLLHTGTRVSETQCDPAATLLWKCQRADPPCFRPPLIPAATSTGLRVTPSRCPKRRYLAFQSGALEPQDPGSAQPHPVLANELG